MAPYNTPQAIRPLEKTICDFAYSNGYDPISVFNDFLRYVIHGFSPGAPPLMDWKYKRQQNRHFMEMLTGWIRKRSYAVPTTASPPSASGRKRARSRKSESCSRPAARIWPIPVSRTGTTRRHPGSRRTGQTWNPPRLWNCSRTCPSTHPTKSIISVVLSHWTAKSRSGCMKA